MVARSRNSEQVVFHVCDSDLPSSWWPRGNVDRVGRFTRRYEGALGGAIAFVSLEAKPDERLEGLLPDCRLEIWGRSGLATVVIPPSFVSSPATLLSGWFATDF
jgi:hypothetical protein